MKVTKEKIIELKKFALSRTFKDDAEEIRFFKHQKPLILGRLLYYYTLFQIESNRPPSRELGMRYYRYEIERLKTQYERDLSFFRYYRSGATYRDCYYFKRGQTEISPEGDSFLFEPEAEFSTGYDRLVARLITVELIYGIHASGSVDNGKADIIDIVTAFERTFHIDLGDVYHTFIAMRGRKNSQTVYLDQMKEKLLKRMDETDS